MCRGVPPVQSAAIRPRWPPRSRSLSPRGPRAPPNGPCPRSRRHALKMVDHRSCARRQEDPDRVDPYPVAPQLMGGQPLPCEGLQTAQLLVRDRLERVAVAQPTSRLHLAEHEGAEASGTGLKGHHVELAETPRPPVPVDDRPAEPFEMRHRDPVSYTHLRAHETRHDLV